MPTRDIEKVVPPYSKYEGNHIHLYILSIQSLEGQVCLVHATKQVALHHFGQSLATGRAGLSPNIKHALNVCYLKRSQGLKLWLTLDYI
jgi:hypothetical protein